MCLEMDSRKWKILGFFIRHTEGGGSEARVTFVTLFFFFEAFPKLIQFEFAFWIFRRRNFVKYVLVSVTPQSWKPTQNIS